MDGLMKTLSDYSVKTWIRFVLFSVFGVFAFFINFRLPEYQFTIGAWQWGKVAAQSNVLVSHFTNFLKAALYTGNFKAMPFVVWAIFGPISSGIPPRLPPPSPSSRSSASSSFPS